MATAPAANQDFIRNLFRRVQAILEELLGLGNPESG
jgi:hypothetical protein